MRGQAPLPDLQICEERLVKLTFIRLLILICAFSFSLGIAVAQTPAPIDVHHYNISVEPDIPTKTLKGSAVIRFASNVNNLTSVEFDCGELEIDSVFQSGAARVFSIKDRRVKVTVPAMKARQTTTLEIRYHGAPTRGIRFFPDTSQVYTVFWTSEWTVCLDAPDDKATLSLTLILPPTLTPQSNGQLVSRRQFGNNKIASTWEQKNPIPTYIFGFAVGPFR